MIKEIVRYQMKGQSTGIIAGKFHNTLIESLFHLTLKIKIECHVDRVDLSGGSFQNRILTEKLAAKLCGEGLDVNLPGKIPVNDQGIAPGQLAIGAATRLYQEIVMHEMSIALSIIEVANAQAEKENASKVTEIELDIGTMSGVEITALNFALEIAVNDSILEKSKVKINQIKARSECLECGLVFNSESVVNSCPKCKELNTRFICGKELQVKSITIE